VRRSTAIFHLLALATLLSGCGAYHIGDPAKLPFSTVHIAPPLNASNAPQASALVGTSLSRRLERSGRVALAPAATADAQVEVTLLRLEREATIARSEDTGLSRRWRVVLHAEITLTDRRTNRPYFTKRTVSAFDEVYSDSGLVTAEYQNMPLLADRLAEALAHEITSAW